MMMYLHPFIPHLIGPATTLGVYWVAADGNSRPVDAADAAAIADAWRTIEQTILDRTHGPQDVW